jgi:hypothetical protein
MGAEHWGEIGARQRAFARPIRRQSFFGRGRAAKSFRAPAGEPLREIALSYDVDHSTISRLKARYVAEV